MDSRDQINVTIENSLQWILNNYNVDEEATGKSKKLLHSLINQLDDPKLSIQRLYLIYLICEQLSDDEDKAVNFLATLFPVPLRKNLASFIGQMVSLAIGSNSKSLLTASTIYLEKEQIKLSDYDVKQLPLNLAESSPSFAAVLIDKGFFSCNQISTTSTSNHHLNSSLEDKMISTNLLTRWLISLNECNNLAITFNGQALIRYSLVGQGQGNSDLHYRILESIENKKLQQLSVPFVIDIATLLSKRGDDDLISRFAHILIIGVQNGICSALSSNQMRNKLIALFPNNLLIKSLVNMKIK